MGGACGMHGREQECVQGFGVEILRKETWGIDRRKTVMWILMKVTVWIDFIWLRT